MLAMSLLRAVLNYVYGIAVARLIQQEIVVHLRSAVYDKLQRLSFRFFDANASGTIINRVTGDVQNVRLFVDGVIIQGVIMALSLAVYLVYMLNLHVMLTIACLATTPLLLFSSLVFSHYIRPAYARNRDLVDTMVGTLTESMQGIQVVKWLRLSRRSGQRARANGAGARPAALHLLARHDLFGPMPRLHHASATWSVLLGYGGWLVIQAMSSQLGTGPAGLQPGLLQQFSGQVSNIATITNSIQESLIGARRVFEVLDAPVEIHSRPGAAAPAAVRGELRFEGVGFSYRPGEPVLSLIDLAVAPGQCVAILGATGSGKSTLMSLIPRFFDPTQGRILLDGRDLRDLDLDTLRRNIGLVFQESFLFSNTVEPPTSPSAVKVPPAQIEEGRGASPGPTGLHRHRPAQGLRDGARRARHRVVGRAAPAPEHRPRGARFEPAILLLDDPTAAIDPETEQEILAAMDNAISGRTTFIVAHRLSTLRRADLILVLEGHTIVQRGTHEQADGDAGALPAGGQAPAGRRGEPAPARCPPRERAAAVGPAPGPAASPSGAPPEPPPHERRRPAPRPTLRLTQPGALPR